MKYFTNGNKIQLSYVPSFELEIPHGETISSVQGFAYVIDCISMLFQKQIPEIGSKPLLIFNDPSSECPMCLREYFSIRLCTEPIYWSQAAYQYAHELCHYAIPNNVDANLRWFEESICDLASHYFLFQIGRYWRIESIYARTNNWQLYADSFIKYSVNTLKQISEFDTRDQSIIHELELNPYNRLNNRYIAKQMFPIFFRYPQTWKAVPHLCEVHQPTLEKSLKEWILLSHPASRPGLLQIQNLF